MEGRSLYSTIQNICSKISDWLVVGNSKPNRVTIHHIDFQSKKIQLLENGLSCLIVRFSELATYSKLIQALSKADIFTIGAKINITDVPGFENTLRSSSEQSKCYLLKTDRNGYISYWDSTLDACIKITPDQLMNNFRILNDFSSIDCYRIGLFTKAWNRKRNCSLRNAQQAPLKLVS